MRMRRGLLVLAVLTTAAAVATGCATTDVAVPASSPDSRSSGVSSPASAPRPSSDLNLAISPIGQINLAGKRFDTPALSGPADPAGNGQAKCRRLTIAVAGDLTTRDGVDGAGVANGVQLAVDQHNAKNPQCPLIVVRVDSQGNTVTAADQAKRLARNGNVLAVIGPLSSAEVLVAGPTFDDAGVVMLSPSATAPTLTDKGWKTFFRGVNNDDVQGESVARYLVGTAGRKRVCVIADDTDGGAALARAVTQGLGEAAVESCSANVRRGDPANAARAAEVVKAGADAVFFAGAARDAGPFAKALREAAPTVLFAAGNEAIGPEFLGLASDAAAGAVLSCSCAADPDPFTAAFTPRFGAPPRYSLEAYDLATVVIRGIAAGNQNRARLRDFVAEYEGNGQSRHYRWAPTGELIGNTVWLYRAGPG
ncbi:putative branched-chain amino acid ABC transporter substrate binding protein [Gordonia araii NBRC 100433]|uniref:Putative branched-chain amino acid ABC transporter substrate binding protein n=1 Tax=Gordonia araii NBRC 100433 TaxID=1073574 RepID=G7H4S8_9ACTN|nr:branched-chain amino acid ABC transporter substrate-binding protein [Gordonia araii]NNG98006.1 ABC transporter substrate-binding protein [Gordonia araii NBRC 100433]GAB10853.1 putative branched-chain amino acid ABC transporter substrate binding protein [Gordonia araii NBRC 100433]